MMISSLGSPALHAVPLSAWEPLPGAVFLVDTKETLGYLMNPDGEYAVVPVLTGQNRVVHYLGRTYTATTPERMWTVESIDTQTDRITFGKEGTFLRLFTDKKTATSYGIHSHAYVDRMIASGDHYRSFGCILVTKDVLDKLQEAYVINKKTLTVMTVFGLDGSVMSKEKPDNEQLPIPLPEQPWLDANLLTSPFGRG